MGKDILKIDVLSEEAFRIEVKNVQGDYAVYDGKPTKVEIDFEAMVDNPPKNGIIIKTFKENRQVTYLEALKIIRWHVWVDKRIDDNG